MGCIAFHGWKIFQTLYICLESNNIVNVKVSADRWVKDIVRVHIGCAGVVAYRGVGADLLGVSKPTWNSEGPPKSCQTQPDCEKC